MVLTLAGGVSPPVPVVSLLFSVSYPQDRRSYYLFFNYLFFNYLDMLPVCSKNRGGNVTRMLEDRVCECYPYARGKLPLIHTTLWKTNDLRAQGASRSGEALEVQTGPPKPLTGR